MSNPYVGEIRVFAGNYAPRDWLFCDGQILPIAEYETLFQLIGTTYGGDGQETFALPDLRGRVAVGSGQGAGLSSYLLGQMGGVEQVTLTLGQIPAHGTPTSSAAATSRRPDQALAAGGSYVPLADATGTQAPVGGGQAHGNMPPFLPLSFIISLFGLYPTPT